MPDSQITVHVPSGASAVAVTFAGPDADPATVYSDPDGNDVVSLPNTVSEDTTYWLPSGPYTVSLTVTPGASPIEVATAEGQPADVIAAPSTATVVEPHYEVLIPYIAELMANGAPILGALYGGTSGQVLTKNSDTPFDYGWATP